MCMVFSKTTSIKACKLCMFCVNQLSQQARWPKGRKKMCTGPKELRFIIWLLSGYSFKGKESIPT